MNARLSGAVGSFEHASLSYPWTHDDARVDALQSVVMEIVRSSSARPRHDVFARVATVARDAAGRSGPVRPVSAGAAVPYVSEPWYCCAEPMEQV